MAQLTVDYIRKFAKTCGFTFSESKGKYHLETPYSKYEVKTLKEVEKLIIRDNRRFSMSRF